MGGLLELFEGPKGVPGPETARKKEKRNEKATWAPVEVEVKKTQ